MKAVAVAAALAWAPPVAAEDYGLVLRNARVVDGTGAPWFRGDIAIRGDAIAAVGTALGGGAARAIDVEGRVVAPGFVDVHTHARGGLFDVPTADNYVRQGVTSLFEGQDGSSALPVGEFLDAIGALGPAVNVGTFVGHGSVREAVMGRDDRAPTARELDRMVDLVRRSMEEGAFGLSTGLFYVPGAFARTDELATLARAAGEAGGIHVSHMRDEAAGVLDSVGETIAIGERGGLPTQITHHKIIGRSGWGRSAQTLRLVEEARARGVDVTIDQYPYTASSTSLAAALIPPWALEGSAEKVKARIRDPVARPRLLAAVVDRIENERGGGDPSRIQIAACAFDESLVGRDLAAILRDRGTEPTVTNAAALVLEIEERGGATAIFHAIGDEDVGRILSSRFTMVASDGQVPVFGEGSPHPRSYGTFARVLGLYVRERGTLRLEEAVRKMTSLPAARTGLLDRGVLRPGFKADLVVFDPSTIRDTATYERPHAYAEGVSLVLVNGVAVVEEGRVTGSRPGRVLRGPGFRRPADSARAAGGTVPARVVR